MAWGDFWELLDGRIWWAMRKQGVKEKKSYSKREMERTRAWLEEYASKARGKAE